MPNLLDSLVAYVAPARALRRAHARAILAKMPGYDAAKPGRNRSVIRDGLSPDQLVERSATHLRAQARDLDRNHDIARGILRTMVNNIVGAHGIGIEPQPRRADGSIHQEYAAELRKAYTDWQRRPEVTKRHTWTKVQRLMARTWIRDGEAFAQELVGPVSLFAHGTRIPFSLEMIEPDLCPFEYTDGNTIVNGIERNTWGEHRRYWFWKTFPGDVRGSIFSRSDMKSVSADLVHHVALLDRIGQTRGVTEFASIITRLADIKNYEESERIAAQVAAALTAFVKRESPEGYEGPLRDENNNPIPRSLAIAPGMIIDDLAPGEDIGMIDSNRPNPNLITFRQGQLRAVASGMGASYSSIAKDYSGTFSSQRQELVEQWVNYATLTDEFTGMFIQPVWETFVRVCAASGQVPVPADVVPGSQDDALFVAQSMPWIDPLKEANGWLTLVRAGFASEVEVIRKRGGNPRDVLEQIRSFRADAGDLRFTSNAENAVQGGAAPEPQPQTTADPEASAVNQALMMSLADIKADMQVRNAPQQAAPTINIATPPVNVTSHAEADMGPVLDIVRESLGGMMAGITQSLAQAIKAGVQSVPAPTILVRAAEQQAPIVNITNDVVVQPATVEATLSMPDRQTTTDLTYNAAGDIVRTVANESTVK